MRCSLSARREIQIILQADECDAQHFPLSQEFRCAGCRFSSYGYLQG